MVLLLQRLEGAKELLLNGCGTLADCCGDLRNTKLGCEAQGEHVLLGRIELRQQHAQSSKRLIPQDNRLGLLT